MKRKVRKEKEVIFALLYSICITVCIIAIFYAIIKNTNETRCDYPIKETEIVKTLQNKETMTMVANTISTKVEVKDAIKVENAKEAKEENEYKILKEVPLDENWQKFANDICKENNVPLELLYALIEIESGFKPDVKSADGKDYGLMQIREINHGWINDYFGYELNYKDPYDSVKAGMLMLSNLLEKQNEDITKALMCYNMGETGAKRAWNNGVYHTSYTEKVESKMNEWSALLNG